MSTPEKARPDERIRVRVTLACGWCGRTIEDAAGQKDSVNGRVLLLGATEGLRISSGRPHCGACGGPMFLEDWHLAYETTLPDKLDFDGDSEPTQSGFEAA
jgi:hypothetical protein